MWRDREGRQRFPSANRCLEVTVTDEALKIQVMAPFGALLGSKQWGYKRSIPLAQIVQVDKARFFGWWHTVRITFATETNQQICLELGFTGPLPQAGGNQLRRRDHFVEILYAARHKSCDTSGPAMTSN